MGCVVRFWGLGWWNLRLNGRYVQLLACCESTISSYPSRPFQTRHSKTHAGIIFVGLKEGFSSYFRSKSKMWKNVSVSHLYKISLIFRSSFCVTSIVFLNQWGAKSAKTSATKSVRSKQIFVIYFASSRFPLLLLLFPLPFLFRNMNVVY